MSAPLDEWRVCGRRVDSRRPLQGCTCNERDPSPWLAAEAITRLSRDKEGGEPVTAPQTSQAARKTSRR